MQDRLKTLEESHQRAMDELQNSHRLKDSTNGLWFRINLAWPYPLPPPKNEQHEKTSRLTLMVCRLFDPFAILGFLSYMFQGFRLS